jgi:hypothetical protein
MTTVIDVDQPSWTVSALLGHQDSGHPSESRPYATSAVAEWIQGRAPDPGSALEVKVTASILSSISR